MTRRLLLQALAGLTAVGASARKLVAGPVPTYVISKAEGLPVPLKVLDRIILNTTGKYQHGAHVVLHVENGGVTGSYMQPWTGLPNQHLFVADREYSVTGLHIATESDPVQVVWEKKTHTGEQ